MNDPVGAVVEAVCAGRKYRSIAPQLVRAVAQAELAKGRSHKEAVKATRVQLHRSAAVYRSEGVDYARWLDSLASAWQEPDRRDALLGRMMASHASTRERLPFLDEFYAHIFSHLPPIRTLLDVACGLNPLALPWMLLAENAAYHAVDIFTDQTHFLEQFFGLAGIQGRAETRDVLADCPQDPVDLALVLKTIPCLEQMEKDAGRRLLEQLNARYLAVSFPVRSLSGRRKGMEDTYSAHFAELSAGWTGEIVRLEFPNELVFVAERG